MRLTYDIKHVIMEEIKLKLYNFFKSDELLQLKEEFKEEFKRLNKKNINSNDLEILNKYNCFLKVEVLKISKTNIYINYFSDIYNFDKIKFDPPIYIIKNEYYENQILNHPKIKKLANNIYLLACNIQSDINKLINEYYLRIDSCKTVDQLLEKFPDMKKFNLIERIKIKHNDFFPNKNKQLLTLEEHKKNINEFYTTYFKEGEKNE